MTPPFHRAAVRFEFLGHGSSADGVRAGEDRLYLDIGNDLRPAVIDHHHLAAHRGSTAALVCAHPELVLEALGPSRQALDPFTIVLHREPDLDGIASTYLTLALFSDGHFPAGAAALVRYIDHIDAGHLGITRDRPFTLYSAYRVLAHRLALRSWETEQDLWTQSVAQGLRVLDFVVKQAEARNCSLVEVDAFACPGLFGPHDRAVVTSDLERYRRKLAAPETHARRAILRFPALLGGTVEAETLLARDVINPADPDRVVFFREWAACDTEHTTKGQGFVGLSRYTPGRAILSVSPTSSASLFGLGAKLDQAEAEERRRIHGVDDREIDPVTKQRKPPRRGYTNSDPWYDGRAHGYTIVDAPREGTVLSSDRIEEIFLEFGRGTGGEALHPTGEEAALRHFTAQATAWERDHGGTTQAKPDVFISYPRARAAWVREHVYEPLAAWRGPERIFFDQHSLPGGAGWLANLAAGVAGCRVFLPIYCPEYFHSEFCVWELQLALIRDPTGRKRIVVPFEVDAVTLPPYCALIQAVRPPRDAFREVLRKTLESIWGGVS